MFFRGHREIFREDPTRVVRFSCPGAGGYWRGTRAVDGYVIGNGERPDRGCGPGRVGGGSLAGDGRGAQHGERREWKLYGSVAAAGRLHGDGERGGVREVHRAEGYAGG